MNVGVDVTSDADREREMDSEQVATVRRYLTGLKTLDLEAMLAELDNNVVLELPVSLVHDRSHKDGELLQCILRPRQQSSNNAMSP